MTLSRQMSLGFFVVLMLVFVGSLWVNVSSTRAFIEQQLNAHAQDTATSLGLSITPYIGNKEDLPVIDTMTNAIFDRGYYQSIKLKDTQNNTLIEKENPPSFESVPAWFIKAFPLQAPVTSTELNNGWNIAGELTVQSNPGFGYLQLWSSAKKTFVVVSLIFLLGLLFVILLAKMITKPINDVVKQSELISNKQFGLIKRVPRTPELKTFVTAINEMSNKLGEIFNSLTSQSEQYRLFAYSDQLTQVGNRRSFELAMHQLLNDAEYNHKGFLIIARLSSLSDVNHLQGHEEGDNYVKSVCHALKETLSKSLDNYSIYRTSGADFAFVIEDITKNECEKLVVALNDAAIRLEKSEFKNGTAHFGITDFKYNAEYSTVLEKADSALSIAETQPEKYQFASGLSVHHSNTEWREQIDKLITGNTSDFAAQAIKASTGEELYSEWFARLPNKSSAELIPMAQLIPASIRLDAAEKLDKMIVKLAFEKIKSIGTLNGVGLNLSRLSILNQSFQSWFLSELAALGSTSTNIVLEIPEKAIVTDTPALLVFVKSIHKMGARITIERFGAQLAGVRHLREIQPDFLKIDGRYIKNIHNEVDNQLFVQSLVSIAHGLNIKIIAETVESVEESNWLANTGVDYQQGYYIDTPKII